ncbi:MAG TPA: CDP-alcohol phosphatidyltransferase family protein [Vicinamibacterales bacterium]|nr:CDP-alcohol phosphatidyltransferase family protein [Vicinamibacterales bacterium]HPW21120.1 CDP-alcohol phosphatidyltransferase family protein [Vicinamibacterales bacterium]
MTLLREILDAAYTPVARAMSGVHPNALTLVSMASGAAAGIAFAAAGGGRGWYAAAGLLVSLSGSADALDGLVARLHGRVSAGGDFLDHAGDRFVEVSILAGIAASPGAHTVFGLSVVILTLLNSYLGTQIEATFGRRSYSGLGKAEQFIGLVIFAAALASAPALSIRVGGARLSAANVLLGLLGAGALVALAHRLGLGWSLARQGAGPAANRAPKVPPR